MAPIGTVGMLDWFSSPEVGIISLIAFLVLSIAFVSLCAACRRSSGNAYDVNGKTTEGTGGNIGTADTKTGGMTDMGSVNWRNHSNMPPNTLERSDALTN